MFLRLQFVYTIIVCDKEVHMLKNNVLWGCDALHFGTNLLMLRRDELLLNLIGAAELGVTTAYSSSLKLDAVKFI